MIAVVYNINLASFTMKGLKITKAFPSSVAKLASSRPQ